MNIKYYISKSGSIIVLDENNNEREIEKTGKYKEILIQENIIETIENRIKELEDIVAKHPIETVNKKKFIPTATIVAIIFSLIIQFISYLLYIETSILVTNLFIALKKAFLLCFHL